MVFVVEAWFHDLDPECAFDYFQTGLSSIPGFRGSPELNAFTSSWDVVTCCQEKTFIGLSSRTENHYVSKVYTRSKSEKVLSDFTCLFVSLMKSRKDLNLAEVFLSVRNPQPYPFLTHSFHRGSFPPPITMIEEKSTYRLGEESYWSVHGPELHFIANEVFERAQVDSSVLASSLLAPRNILTDGVLLDCGWTEELLLPSQLN